MRALSARSSIALARAESDTRGVAGVADDAARVGVLLPPPSDGRQATMSVRHSISRFIVEKHTDDRGRGATKQAQLLLQ